MKIAIRFRRGLAATGALLVVAAPVNATRSVEVSSPPRAHLSGFPESGNFYSFSLASAGDVNGDGRPDVVVGTGNADPRRRTNAGAAYVVFGRNALAPVDVEEGRFPGFVIQGAGEHYRNDVYEDPDSDFAGHEVAGIGDVNRDGLDDVAVSAPFASNRGRIWSGSIYIVFGRRSRTPVDLRTLGRRGYRIDGARAGVTLGLSLARAGDVNGDGLPDIVAGTSPGLYRKGSAYVIYGRPTGGARIDTRKLASRGYRIKGGPAVPSAGYSVAGIGDVNGDGVPDVAVGAPLEHRTKRRNRHGRTDELTRGSVFVVYGRHDSRQINLAKLGDRGYRIDGARGTSAGSSLAPAGDVNGDGRPDLLVSAVGVGTTAEGIPPRAYVVFGGGRLDLARLRGRGIRFGGPLDTRGGSPLAGVGDINGDGLDDVMIGAPHANSDCRLHAGAAYVVYGRAEGGSVALNRLGSGGYRVDGALPVDNAGSVLAGIPDVDGDGRPDLVIGSPAYQNNPGVPVGGPLPTWRADVVPSRATPPARSGNASAPCVRLRVPHTTLRHLKRTGRLKVVVTFREPRRNYNEVSVTEVAGRPKRIAGWAIARKLKPGRPRTVTVRLTEAGLERVRRSSHVRLRVTASQWTAGGDECCPLGPRRTVSVELGA